MDVINGWPLMFSSPTAARHTTESVAQHKQEKKHTKFRSSVCKLSEKAVRRGLRIWEGTRDGSPWMDESWREYMRLETCPLDSVVPFSFFFHISHCRKPYSSNLKGGGLHWISITSSNADCHSTVRKEIQSDAHPMEHFELQLCYSSCHIGWLQVSPLEIEAA